MANSFGELAPIGANRWPQFLPYARLLELAKKGAGEYALAKPYPHIIFDDLFDPAVLDLILDEFPSPHDENWTLHDRPEEVKLQSSTEDKIPIFIRYFLYALNSGYFLKFLEELTGISDLIGDPHFEGGGLHQIVRGGKLAIHADFNKHPRFGLNRRLNLLLYLNKDWKEEYGGYFELWDRDLRHLAKRIAPLFNRVVIFSTTRYSYHGHPDPLACPAGMTRKSLALYYYTSGGTSDEDWSGRHSTLFQRRPGERFRLNAKQIARDLAPPLLWRIGSQALAKLRD